MELMPPSPQEGAGPDSVLIHPYLYPHSLLKLPLKHKSLKKQLGKLVVKGSEKQAESFSASLDQARSSLATAFESTSVSEAAVVEAVATYVGLLLGLVSAAAPDTGATPDDALSAAEGGVAAGGGSGGASPLAAPASQLRHAVQWGWGEAALAPPPGAQPLTSGASDALYELGSVLVGAAIRLMHAAAKASEDSPSGVSTPASTRSYRMLREAAGMLELVAKDVIPSLPGGVSADLDPQVVRALVNVALADAQQLTVLRAIQKGNQPSLIASLAVDAAELYAQAAGELGIASAPGAGSSKLWHYAQYKQAYCLAYAQAFSGITLWKAEQTGRGLKSLEAAAAQLAAAKRASSAYDAAPPATLNLHHRRVDEDLERLLSDTQRRMQRENDAVYIQRVAADVPPLPAGKRLISPLAYALPQPAAVVRDGVVAKCFAAGPAGPAGGTAAAAAAGPTVAPAAQAMHNGTGGPAAAAASAAGGAAAGGAGAAAASGGGAPAHAGEGQGCSCCRWVAALIAFPILAVLWCVGAVLWVLLLPLKCCCPCIGLPLQWAIDLMLWLMRLPARMLLWASGRSEAPSGEGHKQ